MKTTQRPVFMLSTRAVIATALLLSLLLWTGCSGPRAGGAAPRGALRAVDLDDPTGPLTLDDAPSLVGARNEWLSTTVRINGWRGGRGARLRVRRVDGDPAGNLVGNVSVMQVLAMPVDQNRAGFVRQTGLPGARGAEAPRALLPVTGTNGEFDLSTLRDPTSPLGGPAPVADGATPVLLWLDLHIPAEAPAGTYRLAIDLLDRPGGRPVATMPVLVDVREFVLPDEQHLAFVGRLNWETLTALYGAPFGQTSPRLLNRADPRHASAVRTLDRLVSLAHAHRAGVFLPSLQPTVKWPSGEPPTVDWNEFDSVVAPWLTGDAFADRVPTGFWPLPSPAGIERFDARSQGQYWSRAAAHFEGRGWLDRSAVMVDSPPDDEGRAPGDRASAVESIRLSIRAAAALAAHPRLRAALPLDADQVQFGGPSTTERLVPPDAADRLVVAAPGLVFALPVAAWPRTVAQPQRWLRTDLPGLVPTAGAGGGERDVRLWAWLGFLRDARVVLFDDPLPRDASPRRPASPADLVWFYPGEWFGLDEPVPTVGLKWLRRAQQDYEYLHLAAQRGESVTTRLLARLIVKPVELQPNAAPDPVYTLMTGTTDRTAWDGALALVARTILMRQPGELPNPDVQQQLQLETLRWIEPQQRPLLVGRTTQWLLDPLVRGRGNWVDLRLGVDVYNASDDSPARNELRWTGVGAGWRVGQRPGTVPPLQTYRVRRATIDARVNLDELGRGTREPLEATFTHGFSNRQSRLRWVVPAAACDRGDGRVRVDGSLGDWREVDSIHSGPLVRMLDRPNVQQQQLERTSTAANLYTNWADDNLFFAFRLDGADDDREGGRAMRNFVDYQFRRAWGEDLTELLIQPVYSDNSVGPVLHMACKPSGTWVERKSDARTNVDPWAPLEGAAVRYAATIDDARVWRGELAIPWKAVGDPVKGRPVLLRFNFSQHRTSTGESGSWAGPVDFGRDDGFTGILHVRDSSMPR